MRVALSAICFPCSIARYLMWGFQQAGHEVITAGPATGQYIPWSNGLYLDCEPWMPDIELQPQQAHSIKDVLAKTGPVDLIVQCDAHFFLFGDSPVPNVCYAVDNHVREYNQREFDIFFGAHSWGFGMDKPNAVWLPCAYDPRWHYMIGGNSAYWARDVDVCMIGSLYQPRMAAINTLLFSGFSMTIGCGQVYDKCNAMYNAAKMALCTSVKGDLACRVFENMAQGCVVLSDPLQDTEKMGLVDGVHYMVYKDEKTLIEAAGKVRDDERLRMQIVDNAAKWVKGQTWEARARKIMATVAQKFPERFPSVAA